MKDVFCLFHYGLKYPKVIVDMDSKYVLALNLLYQMTLPVYNYSFNHSNLIL